MHAESEERLRVLCVIPARYASTRLPGKPLKDIQGKPMIVRVYERVTCAENLADVIVATDDLRIKAAVEAAGGKAMSRSSIPRLSTSLPRLLKTVQHFKWRRLRHA